MGVVFSFFSTWFFIKLDKNKQSKVLWYAIKDEITANYILSEKWLTYIDEGLENLKKEEIILSTPRYFQINFFKNIVFNLPKEIKNDHYLFYKIRFINHELAACNDIINKIEIYKSPQSSSAAVKIRITNLETLHRDLRKSLMNIKNIIEENFDKLTITDDEMKKEFKSLG